MNRYSYPIRLILMAGILSALAIFLFPHGPYHGMLEFLAIALFGSGLVLLHLQKSGRVRWNGLMLGERFHAWPGSKRVLAVIPGLCAAMIPILYLLNGKLGLSDGQLGFACGALLGISIISLKFRKSGSACCLPEEASPTQQ